MTGGSLVVLKFSMFTVAAWVDDRHRSFERHGRTSTVMLILVDASESLHTEFDKQRDLKLVLKLQCAWPPCSAWPSDPGPSAGWLQCVLAAELCQIQQTRVISACWPILQCTNCQGRPSWSWPCATLRRCRCCRFPPVLRREGGRCALIYR